MTADGRPRSVVTPRRYAAPHGYPRWVLVRGLVGLRKERHMASHDTHLAAGRIPLIGLLVVQLLVGYEWLMSGLTKIVRGGFPSGLADELRDKSQGAAGWYKSLLDGSVIPHA